MQLRTFPMTLSVIRYFEYKSQTIVWLLTQIFAFLPYHYIFEHFTF